MTDLIRIEVSVWDSGCLPELLRKEIANGERHLRVLGSQLSPTEREQIGAYLGQLRACSTAVKKARR